MIRPLHDRILIKRMKADEVSKGGLYLPEPAREKPHKGEVVAHGKGKILEDGTRRAIDVKVGDVVIFGKYSGTEIAVDGDEFLMMREDDIMAVFCEKED
jgi:chaperonin GroES